MVSGASRPLPHPQGALTAVLEETDGSAALATSSGKCLSQTLQTLRRYLPSKSAQEPVHRHAGVPTASTWAVCVREVEHACCSLLQGNSLIYNKQPPYSVEPLALESVLLSCLWQDTRVLQSSTCMWHAGSTVECCASRCSSTSRRLVQIRRSVLTESHVAWWNQDVAAV